MTTGLAAVVMAAGLGTRMRSATPKHLHPLLGRRVVDWVLEAVRPLGAARLTSRSPMYECSIMTPTVRLVTRTSSSTVTTSVTPAASLSGMARLGEDCTLIRSPGRGPSKSGGTTKSAAMPVRSAPSDRALAPMPNLAKVVLRAVRTWRR